MVEELKQQIDTDKNNAIEEKELQDFLKDEKNLQALTDCLRNVFQDTSLSQEIQLALTPLVNDIRKKS
jgi:hypothetical protein